MWQVALRSWRAALAISSCSGWLCFSQNRELILCLINRNARQVPVESAGRVFRRQSVITRRELGQDIKVIYSFGRNPFFLCIERSEDQRDKGFSNSLQLRLPLSFGGKVGMLFSRLLVVCVCVGGVCLFVLSMSWYLALWEQSPCCILEVLKASHPSCSRFLKINNHVASPNHAAYAGQAWRQEHRALNLEHFVCCKMH